MIAHHSLLGYGRFCVGHKIVQLALNGKSARISDTNTCRTRKFEILRGLQIESVSQTKAGCQHAAAARHIESSCPDSAPFGHIASRRTLRLAFRASKSSIPGSESIMKRQFLVQCVSRGGISGFWRIGGWRDHHGGGKSAMPHSAGQASHHGQSKMRRSIRRRAPQPARHHGSAEQSPKGHPQAAATNHQVQNAPSSGQTANATAADHAASKVAVYHQHPIRPQVKTVLNDAALRWSIAHTQPSSHNGNRSDKIGRTAFQHPAAGKPKRNTAGGSSLGLDDLGTTL